MGRARVLPIQTRISRVGVVVHIVCDIYSPIKGIGVGTKYFSSGVSSSDISIESHQMD